MPDNTSLKLADITDANGTSLKSYAETFMEKADEKGVAAILLTMIPPSSLDVATNVPLEFLPDILSQLAGMMRKNEPIARDEINVNPVVTQRGGSDGAGNDHDN